LTTNFEKEMTQCQENNNQEREINIESLNSEINKYKVEHEALETDLAETK
jgi:hypothetical protein